MLKKLKKENLEFRIYENRQIMGENAANDIADKIRELLKEKNEINVLFAAAPSQNDVLDSLIKLDIDWFKVNAFHMDEYVGLENNFSKTFAYYLKNRIFEKVPFKTVNYIGSGEIENICNKYEQLLKVYKLDIVICGIGENAHLAFNDPEFADLHDPKSIKVVELDGVCRQQQVNDKTFDTLDEVPKYAVTLTIPTMLSAKYIFCVVPTEKKAQAVYNTLNCKISSAVPATFLRLHKNSIMYLDSESGSLI